MVHCDSGSCGLVERGTPRGSWWTRRSFGLLYSDDPNDGDYEPETDETNNASEEDPTASDATSSGSSEDEVEEGGSSSLQSDQSSEPWTFTAQGPPRADTIQPAHALDRYYDKDSREEFDGSTEESRLEHIAGPFCEHLGGYHGHRVSVEEMRGCTTIQCLIQKAPSWESSRDDLDFEAESKWRLTGLAQGNHVNQADFVTANSKDQKLYLNLDVETPDFGLAFHPTCLELFMTASRKILGCVDVDRLVDVFKYHRGGEMGRPYKDARLHPADYVYPNAMFPRFQFCKHNEEVRAGQASSNWCHRPGAEYLATNPLFIPGFRKICEAAIVENDDFNTSQSAFVSRKRTEAPPVSGDPFLKLPSELIQLLVRHYLAPKDIAAMRLSSYAFEDLPISLWYHLLNEHYPCVFEAWDDDVQPNRWTYLDAAQLREAEDDREEYKEEYDRKRDVLQQFDPEYLQAWEDNEPTTPLLHQTEEYKSTLREREFTKMEPVRLPRDKTNWFQLYRDINKNWKNLKGLQNRERIWEDVCEIVDKVKCLRDYEKNAEDEAAWGQLVDGVNQL